MNREPEMQDLVIWQDQYLIAKKRGYGKRTNSANLEEHSVLIL